ncbi:MAG: beta-lactamase family protein [Acetobacteraceae bacterium]|nr:beta-lactamase family protein [Acetobacteraceae bacterium]
MTAPDVLRATVERGEVSTAGDASHVPWWSFTKTVIAAAALALVRDGALALDRPAAGKPYTLRQLLQHTAGLGDYAELADYHAAVARGDDPWPVDELLRRCRADELRCAPGGGWRYSNIGYLAARGMIERATGMPLDAALQRAVLAPLGIGLTRLARERADLDTVAMGAADGYHPGWVYHGLLVGPLHEAALLLDRLIGGSLLPPGLIREMATARLVGSAIPGRPWRAPGYGLGVMVEADSGGPLGHTGAGPGSTIAVYRRMASVGPVVIAAFAYGDDQGLVERTAFGLA